MKRQPDFSGTWRFNPERSMLEGPAPDSSVFVIEHDEPRFSLHRTHVADGVCDELTVALTTDGTPVIGSFGPLEAHSTLRWNGDALLFVSTFPKYEPGASNTVRYHLEDGDRTMVAQERLRSSQHSHDNTWVFDRVEVQP
jgi:hypothetical protein